MFYFEELLQQGLGGIDRTAMISTVIAISYAILLVGFLIGIYQAALRGGDLQSLGITAIKYVVIALILANWSSAFREVNSSFNQVAHYIDDASHIGDMFLSWWDQLKQQFSTNGFSALLPAINGGWAAISSALAVTAAYVMYAITFVIFAFFYVLYGCVLYVLGPLVLALLPMPGVGQLAKSYATNLMIWNAWGVLYAIFGSLITAIQFNRVDAIMNQGFLSGFFKGNSQTAVMGIVSMMYAIALALIPFIAKRLISGDVGSTAYSFLKAGAIAVGAAISAGAGIAAGVGGGEAAAAGGAGGGGAAAAGAGTGAGSGATSSSAAPPQPSIADTIRSGMADVAQDGDTQSASESAPSGSAASGSSSGGSGSSARNGGGSRSTGAQTTYRSSSLTNAAAFHVGRFVGRTVSAAANGNGKQDEDK